MFDPANSGSVLPYDGATYANTFPTGLAIESNIFFPLQPANGEVAGQGFDYTNFNRGGLESMFINGGQFVLYNDGRGSPYVAGTYAIGKPVYADAGGSANVGLLTYTSNTNANPRVGLVVSYDQATNPTQLEIKLEI